LVDRIPGHFDALQENRAYAKPRHEQEQDKNVGTGFNKVEVKDAKKFAVKDAAVKVMKQNKKFDDQFGIKTSNLQSTNCLNLFRYELDTKRLTL
jgi:hypothetical protein